MPRIVMTGGGTAGHVTPNIALFPCLKEKGFEISYIGSRNGMEKSLVEREGITYYGISAGSSGGILICAMYRISAGLRKVLRNR